MLFCFCAFYCLQKHKFILSAVFTALAGFTRSLGVVLAAAIFIEGVGTVVRNIRDGKNTENKLLRLLPRLLYQHSERWLICSLIIMSPAIFRFHGV